MGNCDNIADVLRALTRVSDCRGQLQEATRRHQGEGAQEVAGVTRARRNSLTRGRDRSVLLCAKMLQNMKVENICDFSIRR